MPQRSIFGDNPQPVNGKGSFSSMALNISCTIGAMGSFIHSSETLKLAFFYKIQASHAMRIRGYSSMLALNADKPRPSYQKPRVWGYNNHGCIFDVIIGGNGSPLALNFAPIPVFAGDSFSLLIDNLLAASITGGCDLYYLG
ncbi:hypothetical protein [Argonema antarcticum]|uniref:hypothetical protein n=1 Tax=Argonema antarcticum TaxID=2942763 RepID=UPI002011947A|nr:hypothetical protein [Argonema antarcticum]MCL1474426.1 hypothetical protein [Argonema antarcticum A004/B2]